MTADPLTQQRNQKLMQIAADYYAALKAGITVADPTSSTTPPATITLAGKDTDQTQFERGIGILAAAETLAADVNAFRASMVSTIFNRGVTDAAGGSHDMTVTQYRQLCVAYAAAIGTLQNTAMTRTAAARAATTSAAIAAV